MLLTTSGSSSTTRMVCLARMAREAPHIMPRGRRGCDPFRQSFAAVIGTAAAPGRTIFEGLLGNPNRLRLYNRASAARVERAEVPATHGPAGHINRRRRRNGQRPPARKRTDSLNRRRPTASRSDISGGRGRTGVGPMKKRILVVDDEREFTNLLRLSLENHGYYEVQEENDAENVRAAARAFDPDLILLDIMMPEDRKS